MNIEHIKNLLRQLPANERQNYLDHLRQMGHDIDMTSITTHKPHYRPRKIIPTSAAEMARWELRAAAATKRWEMSVPRAIVGGHQLSLTDGAGQSGTLSIFAHGKDTHIECSCDAYAGPLQACQHTEAWRLCIKEPDWAPAFVGEWGRRPKSLLGRRAVRYRDGTGAARLFGSIGGGEIDAPSYARKSAPAPVFLPDAVDEAAIVAATPAGIRLFGYQLEAIRLLCGSGRAICAMPVGSGKTLAAIIAAQARKCKKILIVAPKSLLAQWRDVLTKWTPYSSQILSVADVQSWEQSDTDVGLITYQSYSRGADLFRMKVDLAILDEIQMARNQDTALWSALSKLQARDVFGLSGTAIENNFSDIYSLLQIVDPGILGPRWQFQDTYQTVGTAGTNKIIFGGARNIAAFKANTCHRLYVCNDEIAPVSTVRQLQPVVPAAQQALDSNAIWQSARDAMARYLSGESATYADRLRIQGLLLRARQSAADAALVSKDWAAPPSNKTAAIVSKINELVAAGEAVCVYSEWVEYLKYLQGHMQCANVLFYGGLTVAARSAAISEFIGGAADVFFSSEAGGAGLDGLQHRAAHIIHCEPPWNPARVTQRTARLNRLGQVHDVTEWIYYSADTIEQHVLEQSTSKADIRMRVFYGDSK